MLFDINPYRKSHFYGKNKKQIVILTEVPEYDSFNPILSEVGLTEDDVFFIPTSLEKTKVSDKVLESYLPALQDIIRKQNPSLIIAIGETPLRVLVGSTNTILYRGFKIPDYFYNAWVCPSLDNDDSILIEDFSKALKYLNKSFPIIDLDNYVSTDDLNLIEDYIQKCFEKKLVVIDLETSTLKPYFDESKIICASLCCDNSPIVFPFFKLMNIPRFQKMIKKLLTSKEVTKIAHNLKFERSWFRNIMGYDFEKPYDDTLLLQHLLDGRRNSHGLKFLAYVYFGIKGYEDEVHSYKDMSLVPENKLHKYCASDTLFTYKLWKIFRKKLTEKLKWVYKNLLLDGVDSILNSEDEGVLVSKKELDRLDEKYSLQLYELTEKINNLKEVKEYRKTDTLSLSSSKDLNKFLYDYLKIKPPKITDKGNYSIDADSLSSINTKFTKLLTDLRKVSKMKSTYIDGLRPLIYSDNRLHGDYLLHGTETGRLSSANPNYQNFPKRENPDFRKIFIAPKNHVIISCDYSQWEVRVVAFYCKDPELIKAILNKIDFHALYAEKLFNISQKKIDKTIFKELRHVSKNLFIFPSIYGASYSSISNSINTFIEKFSKYKLFKLDKYFIKSIQDDFYSLYHYLYEWQRKVLHDYSKNGYIETLFGRRRYGPLSYNMIINTPIQSVATDFTLLSMNRCNKKGITIPLMIHDDLTFYALEKIWREKYEIVKRCMTDYDFDFINVPIEIEAKVGKNWYEQVDVEKFKEN